MEGQDVRGPNGFREARAAFLSALPDIRIEIEDVIGEGDQAVVRWRAVGTHGGDGLGIRATQAPVNARGMTWIIVRDGRLQEGWDAWNLGALVEALRVEAAKL